jgi:hypothetical protein
MQVTEVKAFRKLVAIETLQRQRALVFQAEDAARVAWRGEGGGGAVLGSR